MRLILIRHAKAEERDASRYPDDAFRPLSDIGRREQATLAQALKRMGVTFDHLAASPRVRARQTAEILAREMSWEKPLDISDALGEAFTVKQVIKWLQGYPDDATVACVGHEPDLSEFASAMLSSDDSLWIDFKKSGVLAMEFHGYPAPDKGVLLYFLRPKEILRLA